MKTNIKWIIPITLLIITTNLNLTFGQATQAVNSIISTDYLGSSNANNVVFKANGTTRMTLLQSNGNLGIGTTSPGYLLDVSGGDINVASSGKAYRIQGNKMLWYNGTETTNLFAGVGAANAINTGQYNTFMGYWAGYAHTNGNGGTFIGYDAGRSNTTANAGTLIGYKAGYSNTTGYGNTAVGYEALMSSDTTYGGCAFGYRAGQNNTAGCGITAMGENSLRYNTTGTENVAMGSGSGAFNVTGSYNVSIGSFAGHGVTNNSHSYNAFLGSQAGYSITTGGSNTFFGYKSGYSNTTASENVFSGANSGYSNTTGTSNIFSGFNAGYYNATGSYNTATGYKAGYGTGTANVYEYNSFYGYRSGEGITTGDANVFYGAHTGLSGTTASYNTFLGYNSGVTNTTGNANVFIGYLAGYYNSTGANSTFVGLEAGFNSTNDYNTFLGFRAGRSTTSGYQNVATGWNALYGNTTGTYNTSVGPYSGQANTTGSKNTYLGYCADANANNYSNASAIGSFALTTGTNKMYLGDANALLYCAAGIWTGSDGRFKFNVQEEVKGLDFIKKLRPVTYQLNTFELDSFMRQNMPQASSRDSLGNSINFENTREFSSSTGIIHAGFIAQEVEQAAIDCGFTSSIVSKPVNNTDIYALNYVEFVVPMVKAMQEQQEMIDSLRAAIANLTVVPSQRKANPNSEEQNNPESIQKVELSNRAQVVLYQNEPNPFGNQTVIRYFIPENTVNSFIVFYDEFGKEVKTVSITEKGFGKIEANTENLASGIYTYSMIVDGKITDTKKMMRNK